MWNKIITCRMQESDITQALGIWQEQYERYCSSDEAYPDYWKSNTGELEEFLRSKVQDATAIVAKLDKAVIGFMAYDLFPFNGENSVFCPPTAHAAVEEYKQEAYLSLYKSVSKEWVDRDIFNHMWIINYNDLKLRVILYDLDFGSYLVDGFTCPNIEINCTSGYQIRKAELQDLEILYSLVEESRQYYSSAPIFLKRDLYSTDDISKVIRNSNVFIAFDGSKAIGLINLSVSKENDIINLSVSNSGQIDELGAYIKPEFRGKGLGKELLKSVFDFCNSQGIKSIHVDFETANLFANKFWKKYFNPMLLSVRRTINKNIND